MVPAIQAVASKQKTHPLQNEFKVLFNKSGPTIPCICKTVGYLGPSSAEAEQQLVVSVTTDTAVRGNLKYRYEVSDGKILGEGPVVIWDFAGLSPGTYKITITIIADTENSVAKILTRTVELASSPECDCPIICPTITVRSTMKSAGPGDKIRFRTLLFGEDIFERRFRYRWKVLNGKIVSGQGTREIEVLIGQQKREPEIIAFVEVTGLDPAASCPNIATGSVKIGNRSLSDDSTSGVLSLFLDDTNLVIACPRGIKGCLRQSSPDMEVDAILESIGPRKGVQYRYSVTAGKIVGSGDHFKWDLENVPPGTYTISASEYKSGKLTGATVSRTVTVVFETCICDPTCPEVNLIASDFVQPGGLVNVAATVRGGSGDGQILFNWIVSVGEIQSGQNTPAIVVRIPKNDGSKKIKVSLVIGGLSSPIAMCPRNFEIEIPIALNPPP